VLQLQKVSRLLFSSLSIKNRIIYMTHNIVKLSGSLLEVVSRSQRPTAYNRHGRRESKSQQFPA
jgi:flagellar biosynthesis/type III secretory pathway chaperone